MLDCRLRLAAGGDVLVVYLADAPFHQLTYFRRGSSVDLDAAGADLVARPGAAATSPRPAGYPVGAPKFFDD